MMEDNEKQHTRELSVQRVLNKHEKSARLQFIIYYSYFKKMSEQRKKNGMYQTTEKPTLKHFITDDTEFRNSCNVDKALI